MKTDKKIVKYSQLEKLREKFKKKKKTTVLTTGCYDILHLGHVIHFCYCKSKGDVLFVSVGNDNTVRALKGPSRPINNEIFRAKMLASLQLVDYVIISEEFGTMDHNKIVELLKPKVYVVPATDSMLKEKRKLVKDNDGQLVTCRRLPPGRIKGGISTTQIVSKLKKEGKG